MKQKEGFLLMPISHYYTAKAQVKWVEGGCCLAGCCLAGCCCLGLLPGRVLLPGAAAGPGLLLLQEVRRASTGASTAAVAAALQGCPRLHHPAHELPPPPASRRPRRRAQAALTLEEAERRMAELRGVSDSKLVPRGIKLVGGRLGGWLGSWQGGRQWRLGMGLGTGARFVVPAAPQLHACRALGNLEPG
jgi:hypothetical protein